MVTDQTYTQFRLTKMKFFMTFRRSSVKPGEIADSTQIPIIKTKLGTVTPILSVVFFCEIAAYNF